MLLISPKNKDGLYKIALNYLLSQFFYAIISVYAYTQTSFNYVLNMTWQILNYDEKLWQISWNKSHWPYIPCRTLIIGGSRSGKTDVLPTSATKYLTKFIDASKIYSNQKINYLLIEEKKYRWKSQKIQKHLLVIYKQLTMPIKIWKSIIQQQKKSVNSVWKAKNIAFVSQSYFKVPKTIWLNLIHCFIMKMPKRTEL